MPLKERQMFSWDDPKFRKPTDAVGDWHVVRSLFFEDERAPIAMKWAIEKMTVQLLRRAPIDTASTVLRYSGTSSGGGHPSTVHLELAAVGDHKHLYALTSERTAPKRWEREKEFIADCDRRFDYWRAQLAVVPDVAAWQPLPRESLIRLIHETLEMEDAASQVTEDPAPIHEVQHRVLNALRAGMGFFTAHKEGGSHLFFDGKVYRRNDYGEEPNHNEVYPDDESMLTALRLFYSWDAQRDTYPHPKPELAIWNYIHGQLRAR